MGARIIAPARLRGSVTALVTPFSGDAVDEAAVTALVARQVAAGTAGIVVCGSTGEAPALSAAEHRQVVAVAVIAAAGRIPIYAGVGAANTAQAVQLALAAREAGADGLLCSAPPYVKPTQAGLIAHVAAVFEATRLGIMLYDIPGRTSVAFSDDTIVELFLSGRIVALKDASGDLSRPLRLRARCGDGLAQLTGDDATAAGYLAMSGDGCVSVTANVAPALCAALHAAWRDGDLAAFGRANASLAPLHQAMFLESNPIPVKAALQRLGLIDDGLRLPLTSATPATRKALAGALRQVEESKDWALPRPAKGNAFGNHYLK